MQTEKYKNESVISLGKGGFGQEANIKIELRRRFPGIGGTIKTQEGALIALREQLNKTSKSGHKMFLKHTLVKKLDDYFFRTKKYLFPHIPRPLGSISKEGNNLYEAYIYEWAYGKDNFPWEVTDYSGKTGLVEIDEWNIFVQSFNDVGIDMSIDIADNLDGRISKNIIHQFPIDAYTSNLKMNLVWKRIDFGSNSLPIDYEKLSKFLKDNKSKLIGMLRMERYEMVKLAIKYLTNKKMDRFDIGKLDILVASYRYNSLRHYVSRGSGIIGQTYIDEGIQSLI